MKKKASFVFRKISFAVFAAIILLGALNLRITGIHFGFPDLVYGDEHILSGKALQMMANASLRPDNMNRPVFYAYLLIPFYALTGILHFVRFAAGFADEPSFIKMWRYYEVGRYITAAFGTMLTGVVFLTAYKKKGLLAAIIAGTLCACGTVQVKFSHFIKEDVPTAFFSACTFYFVFQYVKTDRIKHILAAACFAGITVGAKYTAAFIPLAVAAAVMNSVDSRSLLKFKPMSRKTALAGAALLVSAAAFFAVNPYALIDFNRFISPIKELHLQRLIETESADLSGADKAAGIVARLSGLKNPFKGIIQDMGLFSAGAAFLWFTVKLLKRNRAAVAYAAFFIPTVVIIGRNPIFHPSYILPLVPVLYLFAALSIIEAAKCIFKQKPDSFGLNNVGYLAFIFMLTGIFLYQPLINVRAQNREFRKKDTRSALREWISENLNPEKVKIAKSGNIPPLPGFCVREYWTLGEHSFHWYLNRGYTHFAVNQDSRFREYGKIMQSKVKGFDDFYLKLRSMTPLQSFHPDDAYSGPPLDIYQASPEKMILDINDEERVLFDNGAALLAAEIQPKKLKPWDFFNIALYIENYVIIDKNFLIELIIEKDSRVLIRDAKLPFDGFRLPENWKPGQLIIEDRKFRVPEKNRQLSGETAQQKLLYPDIDRGFVMDMKSLGRFSIKRNHYRQSHYTTLKLMHGKKLPLEPNAISSSMQIYSQKTAEMGMYDIYLKLIDTDGRLVEPIDKESPRIKIGEIEITAKQGERRI